MFAGFPEDARADRAQREAREHAVCPQLEPVSAGVLHVHQEAVVVQPARLSTRFQWPVGRRYTRAPQRSLHVDQENREELLFTPLIF